MKACLVYLVLNASDATVTAAARRAYPGGVSDRPRIVHVDIPEHLHKRMRVLVAASDDEGETIKRFVTRAIEHEVERLERAR